MSIELHYQVPAAFLIPSQSSVWPLPACPQPYTILTILGLELLWPGREAGPQDVGQRGSLRQGPHGCPSRESFWL